MGKEALTDQELKFIEQQKRFFARLPAWIFYAGYVLVLLFVAVDFSKKGQLDWTTVFTACFALIFLKLAQQNNSWHKIVDKLMR